MNEQVKQRKRTITRYRTTHTTTVKPFHRVVLVEAWEEDWTAYPVLAIESRTRHRYELQARFDDSDPIQIHDHEDFVAAGFCYAGEAVEHGVLIFYPEYNEVVSSIDDDWKPNNCEYAITCCCWPESEDKERLSEIAKNIMEEISA